MDDKEIMIDQSQLAEDVASKINYDFMDAYLVKPLEPIKVKKEITEPVYTSNKPEEDKNGVIANDYEVKTEVKEVDSDYRKGVILKVPYVYTGLNEEERNKLYEFKVGDVIVFREAGTKTFDLVKDTRLIKRYEIIAKECVNN